VSPEVRGVAHSDTVGACRLAVALVLAVSLWPRASSGEEKPRHPVTSLDGLWLTAGPIAGAVHLHDSWNSLVGAELSVVRLREADKVSVLGLAGGFVVFDEREGARVWTELELGTSFGSFGVGVSAGVTAEFDQVVPPRWGTQGTLWLYAGIVPYVRVGVVEETGRYVETGVMIKVPLRILY
jgi:hypothetical protein